MNKHLKSVREFHDTFFLLQAEHGANARLSDMNIILRQALLMDAGSATLKAIKSGDMVEILSGLVNLAYSALGAIAIQGGDVTESPVTWRHDGFVLSIMRILSDGIHRCSSGNPEDYSGVYCLCAHLSRIFINADFDLAFQRVHEGKMSQAQTTPDLSDCLYE